MKTAFREKRVESSQLASRLHSLLVLVVLRRSSLPQGHSGLRSHVALNDQSTILVQPIRNPIQII